MDRLFAVIAYMILLSVSMFLMSVWAVEDKHGINEVSTEYWIGAFIVYLLCFIAIGLLAHRKEEE